MTNVCKWISCPKYTIVFNKIHHTKMVKSMTHRRMPVILLVYKKWYNKKSLSSRKFVKKKLLNMALLVWKCTELIKPAR